MSRHLKVTIEVWAEALGDEVLAHVIQEAVNEACEVGDAAHPLGLDRLSCDGELFVSRSGALLRVSHENTYRSLGVPTIDESTHMRSMPRHWDDEDSPF